MRPALDSISMPFDTIRPAKRQQYARGGRLHGAQVFIVVVKEGDGQGDRVEGRAAVAYLVRAHPLRLERRVTPEVERRPQSLLDIGIERSRRAYRARSRDPQLVGRIQRPGGADVRQELPAGVGIVLE